MSTRHIATLLSVTCCAQQCCVDMLRSFGRGFMLSSYSFQLHPLSGSTRKILLTLFHRGPCHHYISCLGLVVFSQGQSTCLSKIVKFIQLFHVPVRGLGFALKTLKKHVNALVRILLPRKFQATDLSFFPLWSINCYVTGDAPYSEIQAKDLLQRVKSGHRMEKPVKSSSVMWVVFVLYALHFWINLYSYSPSETILFYKTLW